MSAVWLTTVANNDDNADVAVVDAYSDGQSVFSNCYGLSDSHCNRDIENVFPVVSTKLTLVNSDCTGGADGIGTLVYAAAWNQLDSKGSSLTVPLND